MNTNAVCRFLFLATGIVFLFFFPVKVSAQQVPDTNEINASLDKVWPMHFRSLDSALMISNYCYQQARQTPNRRILARSMHMVGVIEQEAGNYRRSIMFLDSAITIAKRMNDQKRLGQLYNSIGMSYYMDGDYKIGMEYVLNSASLKEGIGDYKGTITTYINISALYGEQADTANEMKYARNASEMCQKQKATDLLPEVNDALGRASLHNRDTLNAFRYLEAALAEADKSNTPLKALRSLESLASLSLDQKDTARSRKYILKFDEYAKITNDKSHLAALYYSYARYYLLKKDYRNSERFSRICIGLSEGKSKPEILVEMYGVYLQSLKAQNKTADVAIASRMLNKLNDSVAVQASNAAARRLAAEYAGQQKDKQSDSGQEETADNSSGFWNHPAVKIIAGIFGLVLIFFLSRRYLFRKK